MDLPPALLPVERVLVVRECASRNRADDCDYRSALHANLPHRQRALEHGGISASLRLQSRAAYGKSQCLPRLVGRLEEKWMGQLKSWPIFDSCSDSRPS